MWKVMSSKKSSPDWCLWITNHGWIGHLLNGSSERSTFVLQQIHVSFDSLSVWMPGATGTKQTSGNGCDQPYTGLLEQESVGSECLCCAAAELHQADRLGAATAADPGGW